MSDYYFIFNRPVSRRCFRRRLATHARTHTHTHALYDADADAIQACTRRALTLLLIRIRIGSTHMCNRE